MEIVCRFESGVALSKEQLETLLRPLNDTERFVVAYRFGWMDGVTHTLQETGDSIGLTREHVRRIEMRACRRMRTASR